MKISSTFKSWIKSWLAKKLTEDQLLEMFAKLVHTHSSRLDETVMSCLLHSTRTTQSEQESIMGCIYEG